MQDNYYFLKHLSPILHKELENLPLVACFSQNKDELLLSFANKDKNFTIKALLSSVLCCLSFPNSYNRSRKNSVDLFQAIIGYVVKEVRQLENERGFVIEFVSNLEVKTPQETKSKKSLLFKMQGQRANIVLFETLDLPDLSYSSDVVSQIENRDIKREEVTEIFKSELEKDWQLNLTQLNRIIDQTEVAFSENGLQKTFPTFDKTMLQALEKQTGKSAKEAIFAEVLLLLQEIENPTYYITEKQINDKQKELQFTLFKPTKIIFQSQNPIEVLNEFQKIFTHSYYFETEKNEALKKVETKIKQTQQYLKKIEEKLWELIGTVSYQEIADIIMANLHNLPSEAQRISQIVELFDFYHNTTITIKLKEHLTPQKTAESYYRKAKNQKIEIDRIEQNIAQKKQLLTELVENAKQIALATDFKDMRSYLQEKDLDNKKEDVELHLFKKFTHEGFEIWIGKNAQNNDLLTQRYAYKEDLWLHARDVTGSHVIIKYQAGKVFPNSVIERAAQLAAYFSKRKNDTLCPVSYTPKKYVRKPKGAKDGSVKIEREDVIMVRPMIEER